MSDEQIAEARRQLEICNACRYCEGYCSVFPAVHRQRAFTDGDITQFANLCHNCRGCYYACQYTAPHEFDLNLPQALAAVRQESWHDFIAPSAFARLFHRSGAAVAGTVVVGMAILIWLVNLLGGGEGEGFYAVLSHDAMVAIFMPAFLLPIAVVAHGVWRYWRSVGGTWLSLDDLAAALRSAASMRNLSGGHGDGCNFEDEDRFSNARRWFHQATMYGFLLCFASTSAATVLHYVFDAPAPYPPFSLPKLLGVPGGILLCIGCLGLGVLKTRSDPALGDARVWGGEMGFCMLLFIVSASGLALYWLSGTAWLTELLVFHLGAVLAFFLLTPYSKMVHGFFRLAALLREVQIQSALSKATAIDRPSAGHRAATESGR